MRFEAKWLPGGSVELEEIPLKGRSELRKLDERGATIISVQTSYAHMVLAKAIIAAERSMSAFGLAETKAAWDKHMMKNFGEDAFIWPSETFEESLRATREVFIERELGATSTEDAKAKIEMVEKGIEERAKAIDQSTVAEFGRRPLLALYWHLRASGVKSIALPTGEVSLDWSLDPIARGKTMDAIEEVVTVEQLQSLSQKSTRPADAEDYKPKTSADVLGKSEPNSMPTTPSSPDSPPSLATTAGPGRLAPTSP
jgi:hypothetical protein